VTGFILPDSTLGGPFGFPQDRFRPFLRVTSPQTGLAVSVSDAREHLRIYGNGEDEKVKRLIKAATGRVEAYTRRVLTPASYAVDLCAFPYNWQSYVSRIDLPLAPVRAVTAVKTAVGDGTFNTIDPAIYVAFINRLGRGFVQLAAGQSWPSVAFGFGNVSVEFDAGYLTSECPAELQQAILLIVGSLYENASELSATPMTRLPDAVESLAGNYRVLNV
jgi:uncharacterized phiE125 gp8 family phage protein